MGQTPLTISRLPLAVAEALARGASILTPNQRAAHALRHAWRGQSPATNHATSPDILSLDTWMTQLWSRRVTSGDAHAMLLNRAQEHALWQSILAADSEISASTALDPLIEMAMDAWGILCGYLGQQRMRESAVSTDTRAFQRWALSFERSLAANALLSPVQLPEALDRALSEGTLPLPGAGVLLVDFNQLTPALESLFLSIRRAGYDVGEHHTSRASDKRPQCLAAAEEGIELETATQWIAQRLNDQPGAKIALVVPTLSDRRATVARALRQALPVDPATGEEDAFEFSLGTPLADTPMVGTALDLLRWPFEALSLDLIGELFLSPFFGGAEPAEASLAALFDVAELRRMRLLLRPELTLEETIALVSSRQPRLVSLLQRMRALHHVATDRLASARPHTHAECSDLFRALLEAAGWDAAGCNATRGRGSLEWQTHRRFESVLDELATLDFDGSRVTAAQALTRLTRLARTALFAPESSDAPVQVLGPLELGGVPFDALWFLGAGDLGGLPTPAPSPLLSWHLQHALGVPGTDSARDQAAAAARMAAIARFAPETVFSFAETTEEGHQRLTGALQHLSLDPFAGPAPHPSFAARPFEQAREDAVIPPPDPLQPGGARVLELQSACGFRAFAELRLASEEPDRREPGLNAMERGNLVHAVMEHFWAELEDQQQLNALSHDEREQHLDACIRQALQKAHRGAKTAWDHAYLATQHKRLLHLLRPWLEMEALRPEFRVRVREQGAGNVPLGPLLLTLRPDRIDETAEGLVILDYKTGAAAPSDWLSERPDAPQLPLYAVLTQEKVAGVAFALLHPGKGLALKGFADSAEVFGKPSRMPLPMDEQLAEWQLTLTRLATAFHDGQLQVDPKQYPSTCNFCAQRILCRLDPAALAAGTNDPDENEADRG